MQKTPPDLEIDKLDKQILAILIEDAMVPYTDIAKKLLVSGGTIHVRMKKLQEMGVIRGNNLSINPTRIGYDVCAFLGIYLNKASEYRDAVKELERIPELVEMHYTTGTYSMFAKIICKDTKHLREVLNEKIQVIRGVQRTETFISLEESIRRQIKIV
jgi:Lrp/AsnC family transcriptional regulator for asnA, asnC and gidA